VNARVHPRRARFPEPGDCDLLQSQVASTGRFDVPMLRKGVATTIRIDMSTWSRPRLARAFATALRDYLLAPSTVCTRAQITSRLTELKRFWQFLQSTRTHALELKHITPALIDAYERWLAGERPGFSFHQRALLGRIIYLLRSIEEVMPGTLRPDTAERCAYVSLEPCERGTPRDAYSSALVERIRSAAAAQVREAATRIALEGTEPPIPESCDLRIRDIYREAITQFDQLGWVYARSLSTYKGAGQRRRSALLPPFRWAAIPGLFYLTPTDVIAFVSLIVLVTGMELAGLLELKTDCLQNAREGSVEIEYVKRRARGAEHKRLRVRDGGINTPGGLLRLALRLTARARRHKGGEALWVYAGLRGLQDEISLPNRLAQPFTRAYKLTDDEGRPLRLSFSRLRKSHKAEWYVKTQGQLDDFAVGHTREVAAKHYADIPALRHVHEATIAEGLADALDDALKPKILLAPQDAPARHDGGTLIIPDIAEDTIADSQQEVWLASCSGFYSSPFSPPGKPCSVPFWGCLECPNAVISARKLPAIIGFLSFIVEQRESLSSPDWLAKFGRAYRRISEQILPAFPESDLAIARAIAKTGSDIYLPPEASTR
jgi:hypothetical protein